MNRYLFLILLFTFHKSYAKENNTIPQDSVISEQEEKKSNPILASDKNKINSDDLSSKNFTDNTDIYEVNVNENWSFSGLIKIEKQVAYIPLKFLPSDLLGNLVINEQTTQIIKNERNLVFPATFIKKRDDESLVISIFLNEDYFKSQRLASESNKKLESHPINAFYTNYTFSMDESGISTLKGTLNTVWASKSNWLFKNNLFWNGHQFVRLNSIWQKTFNNMSGLSVGDVTDTSLNGFGSINVLGFKYSTPYFNSVASISQSLPTIPISGFAITPGKMDLFLNSQLIQQKEISSGRYSLDVPYQTKGYGVFQAYVYDINGKPNIVSVPFYSNNEIIKKGSHEYSVTGGFIRKDSTASSTTYDKPFISGIYKGGISDNWTQDLYFQHSAYYSAISGISHFIPHSTLGMLNLGYSRNSENQSMLKFGWERSSPTISFGGDFQKSQNKDSGFCLGYNQSCIREQKTLFIGSTLPYDLGSLNLSYVNRSTTTSDSKITTLQWNKQVNKLINIFSSFSDSYSVNYGNAPINNKVFYLGLSLNMDSHFYTNSSYTNDRNSGISYQQSFYKGENIQHPEYGYGSLTINKNKNSQTENLYYGAHLSNFSYNINSYKDEKGIKSNFTMDGALSYVPEENYFKFTKSMTGGLVFVNIDNLTIPAEIYHENRFSGMTDKNGRFLVSDAVALNSENVSVNINKLPKSITLDNNNKQYYIPFSGAVRVDFKSKPLPYIVKIKGVSSGAIFELNKEFYVVGDKGNVSVESEGAVQIPMDKGETCNLNITKKQKEYICSPINITSDLK